MPAVQPPSLASTEADLAAGRNLDVVPQSIPAADLWSAGRSHQAPSKRHEDRAANRSREDPPVRPECREHRPGCRTDRRRVVGPYPTIVPQPTDIWTRTTGAG